MEGMIKDNYMIFLSKINGYYIQIPTNKDSL